MNQLLPLAIVVGLLAGPAVSAPDPGETVEAFHAALAAGRMDEAAGYLSDDLVVYEEGHVEASKAEYVRTHLPQDVAYLRGVTETATASRVVVRGESAWVLRQATASGTFHGQPVNRVSSETVVLEQGPTGWRIVHIHWSSHKAG
ncbi:MAG: nuclear transport factor 2 family protein [Caulobacteraceae bacterium]|nr:nuclear transport factor 2 family protein [Caulobacteraceae bacterium]